MATTLTPDAARAGAARMLAIYEWMAAEAKPMALLPCVRAIVVFVPVPFRSLFIVRRIGAGVMSAFGP